MSGTVTLPDPDRFFEIRFESIGGFGAHAAGQILASAAVLRMDLNGAHFSSYGSEKKGSIVRSFVRLGASEKPIRTSSPIESPDVVVVFHDALLANPATLAGFRTSGTLIYNSPKPEVPDAFEVLPKDVKVVRIDALKIALEEKSRPNAVLLGTLCAVCPFLDPEVVLGALSDEFASKHPEAVASNERAYRRGGSEFVPVENPGTATDDLPIMRSGPVWGYETAPLGGILPTPGNSISNDLTASRTGWIPVLHRDKCIDCGLCDIVCPDMCLVWSSEGPDDEPTSVKLEGIDYRYCKGCLRCIETCSTEAMTKEPETPGMADELRVPLFPEIK
jgi:pyruvate ferredoxin oxidoreductase gamma subunit